MIKGSRHLNLIRLLESKNLEFGSRGRNQSLLWYKAKCSQLAYSTNTWLYRVANHQEYRNWVTLESIRLEHIKLYLTYEEFEFDRSVKKKRWIKRWIKNCFDVKEHVYYWPTEHQVSLYHSKLWNYQRWIQVTLENSRFQN